VGVCPEGIRVGIVEDLEQLSKEKLIYHVPHLIPL
jgi:hypothetical protein